MRHNEKNQKTLKSFAQLINSKAEPIIQSGWIRKKNTKGKEDNRFFVASSAALYLCKMTGIVRALKIRKELAWIDLLSFKMISDITFSFVFNKITVTFIHPEPACFLSPVLTHIKTLLPDSLQITIDDPPGTTITASTPRSTQYVDLFLSCCHSINVSPNENFCVNLRKQLRQGEPLSFIYAGQPEPVVKSAVRALQYSKTVTKATFGGYEFPDLFVLIGLALIQNTYLESLELIDYQKSDGFVQLTSSLCICPLKHIIFTNVKFTQSMMQELTNTILSTKLEALSFSRCHLENDVLQPIFNDAKQFQQLLEFDVVRDEEFSQQTLIPKYVQFMDQSKITKISLSRMGIDIARFFFALEGANVLLEDLNLSHNHFSKAMTRSYNLPETIKYIDLKSVNWEIGTLARFLSMQNFVSIPIRLNLSRAIFEESVSSTMFNTLPEYPPTPMIGSIEWNKNPITTSLLTYFQQYSFLEEVYFDDCQLLDDDIEQLVVRIADFLLKVHLTVFSIRGTLRKLKHKSMVILKNALNGNPTLRKLNISDNAIGDSGLVILQDIIKNAQKPISVSFDCSDIQQPLVFINFLKEVANSPNLLHLSKPRTDFEVLSKKSSKSVEHEIRDAWNLVSTVTEARNDPEAEIYPSVMASMNSGYSSTMVDATTYIESSPVSWVMTSWDISIDIGYKNNIDEWDKLSQQFSIPNITGIPIKHTRPDSINLIEFSPGA